MLEIRIDGLLGERGHTFYWLSKQTGVSHATLWRLKTGRARGINFETLEKICRALVCQPGDVLGIADGEKAARPRAGSPDGKGRGSGLRGAGAAKRRGAVKGVR